MPRSAEIFDVAQRERISRVHDHREANDLRRAVEIAEWIPHPLSLAEATPANEFDLTPPPPRVRAAMGDRSGAESRLATPIDGSGPEPFSARADLERAKEALAASNADSNAGARR